MATRPELPDVAGLLGRAVERSRPGASLLPDRRAELLACAEREEEIARRVEALDSQAAAIQRDIQAEHPDLPDVYTSLFEGRSVAQQLAIQALGERLRAGPR